MAWGLGSATVYQLAKHGQRLIGLEMFQPGHDQDLSHGYHRVDRHPAHEQVLIGCGFSGRGYKFTPTAGAILADLATDGTTRHDIGCRSERRFNE